MAVMSVSSHRQMRSRPSSSTPQASLVLKLLFSHLMMAILALQAGFLSHYRRKDSLRFLETSTDPPRTESKRPAIMTRLLTNFARLDAQEFIDAMDFGGPQHPVEYPWTAPEGARHVTILYASSQNLAQTSNRSSDLVLPLPSLASALGNCREIRHVIMMRGAMPGPNQGSCLAIVENADAYWISKWAHVAPGSNRLERVSRFELFQDSSSYLRQVPAVFKTEEFLGNLHEYLKHVDSALTALRPLADRVASAGSEATKGVIVVMVCNFGHSELLINFVCASRVAGFDLSKVLFFATDQDTHDLAGAMGLTSFYHEGIFDSIPREASDGYGDRRYSLIMLSKIYAVHLAHQLGHDILFQDVDVIPYSPQYLEYFVQKARSGTFDLYFQHDFNLRTDYSPWTSNTGCYYAVSNARTRSFFEAMLMLGDRVLAARSHQAAVHTLLSEHASQFGLRIKNLISDHRLLPIGRHFHRDREFMKAMLQGSVPKPLSFHMNWNENKQAKQKFLEQLGDWYVQPQCTGGKALGEIAVTLGSLNSQCCATEPLFKCHFRDKPSMKSCADSPAFDSWGYPKSFW